MVHGYEAENDKLLNSVNWDFFMLRPYFRKIAASINLKF